MGRRQILDNIANTVIDLIKKDAPVNKVAADIHPNGLLDVSKDTNILYHGGSKIDDINLSKSNWDDTFYMSNNKDYAKSYGGNDSVLNRIELSDKANLIDLKKPTTKQVDDIAKQIEIEKGKPQYKGYGNSFDFHPYTQSQVIDGIKQGKAHFIEHPNVKKILKDMGYDGMKSAESTMGDNIGVWNKKVLNNKGLL